MTDPTRQKRIADLTTLEFADELPPADVTEETMDEVMPLVKSFLQLLAVVDTEKLTAVVKMMERFDTTGPIFAPSEWMRTNDRVRQDARLLRAVLALRVEMDQITS